MRAVESSRIFIILPVTGVAILETLQTFFSRRLIDNSCPCQGIVSWDIFFLQIYEDPVKFLKIDYRDNLTRLGWIKSCMGRNLFKIFISHDTFYCLTNIVHISLCMIRNVLIRVCTKKFRFAFRKIFTKNIFLSFAKIVFKNLPGKNLIGVFLHIRVFIELTP